MLRTECSPISCYYRQDNSRAELERGSRRASRIFAQIIQREDLLRLCYNLLTSFSPKSMSMRILFDVTRLHYTLFDVLRSAPVGAAFTVCRRKKRIVHGKVRNDLEFDPTTVDESDKNDDAVEDEVRDGNNIGTPNLCNTKRKLTKKN